MKSRFLILFILLLIGLQTLCYAELGPIANPLWLRNPAISPDGSQIVFSFEGQLSMVPKSGGAAHLLVNNTAHNTAPVWSPDGKNIAYASSLFGNFDVFLVAANGGPSRRLTTHSAAEIPTGFTPDGKEVLFSAHRMDSRENVMFPYLRMVELYQVPIEAGRRPIQILTTPALNAHYNKAGTQIVYEDYKGYENVWRKHHQSPIARDIWLYDCKSGQHKKLTSFAGEDREPVWAPDQESIFYLSEKDGTSNVWKLALADPEKAVQITHFAKNPVRFLTTSDQGDLCFGYDGEIYTLPVGQTEPQKVNIGIPSESEHRAIDPKKLSDHATEMVPSPDGQEVAFVVRGEVFVASTEFGDTRRITNTPEQERSVNFSPDGRHLVFAGERDGSWNLYEASLPGKKKDQPYFYNAPSIEIKTLLKNEHDNFQPAFSPDGKEVAFLEDRTTLKVLNLATQAARTVLPGDQNYSYADGDQWYDWSPDGKWFFATFIDHHRWSNEIGLIDSEGKKPLLNLTKSGYEDNMPLWSEKGNVMLWISDRAGLHGTSGKSDADVYAMFLNQTAFDRYNLGKSDYALLKKQEEEADDEKESKDKKDDGKSGKKKAEKEDLDAIKLPEPIQLETENLEDRTARLTLNSSELKAAVLTPDGETLYYLSQGSDSYDLWKVKLREHSAKKIGGFPASDADDLENPAPIALQLDRKGENGFILADGKISTFKLPKDEEGGGSGEGNEGGDVKMKEVSFAAELNLNSAAERIAMFDHVWRQTKEKFYLTNMNGVDWDYYGKTYRKFLPFITDNYDFAEMLSEMAGELNASHMGSGFHPEDPAADATAALGAFYDPTFPGPGLKIAEVIEGGPLINSKLKIKAGMVIEKIDGSPIPAGTEFDSLLNRRAGKPLLISIFDPATQQHYDQSVKPIGLAAENELLYARWVKTRREEVHRLSNNRLGYIHVRSMDDGSFREAYSDTFGRESDKEALIVDTRFNGGGNLHDELATMLSGQRYLEFVPRGQQLGWEPTSKWTHPSLVLISESNYSDAHLFPWTYRHMGIGKLLGMPLAGTGTAVWWETLQDDTLYYGIPEVGFRDEKGEFMETARIDPDIVVANDPAKVARGEDQQLEKAVETLLQKKP